MVGWNRELGGFNKQQAADEGFQAAQEGVGVVAFAAADEDLAEELQRRAEQEREGFPAAARILPQRGGRCGVGFVMVI